MSVNIHYDYISKRPRGFRRDPLFLEISRPCYQLRPGWSAINVIRGPVNRLPGAALFESLLDF
jgi:hypothetical protein